MTPHGMQIILQAFPQTKWASDTSAKYMEAFTILKPYEDSEIEGACRSLKASLTRSAIKVEEVQAEVRRLRRRSEIRAEAERDAIDEAEVDRDRKAVTQALVLATREEIAAGVAHCRRVAALTGEALPADVTEWTPYQRGMVWAAMDGHGVFR